jgi:hypothetical protein
VLNPFLRELVTRSERQIAFSGEMAGDHTHQLDVGVKGKNFWVTRGDLMRAREWYGLGFTEALKTPDNTLIFVTPGEKAVIRKDQADCMGCLSQCAFSSWADNETNSTGRLADPRSFWRPGGAEPDVRRPQRLQLQKGPVLLERIRADGEATRRPHPDRRLSQSVRGKNRFGLSLSKPSLSYSEPKTKGGLRQAQAKPSQQRFV